MAGDVFDDQDNFTYKEVKIGEYYLLKDILNEQQLYHYNLNGPYSERFLEINENNFEEYMKRKHKSIVYVASVGTNIIGFTSAYLNHHNEGFIEDLFVTEEYRNRKVGSTLFTKVLEWLKDNGAKSMDVHVSIGNEKVMKFYENNGFKMTGYTMKMEIE